MSIEETFEAWYGMTNLDWNKSTKHSIERENIAHTNMLRLQGTKVVQAKYYIKVVSSRFLRRNASFKLETLWHTCVYSFVFL